MDVATISLIASVIAIVISAFNLGWNIYKDAIRKPKFKVTIDLYRMIHQHGNAQNTMISIEIDEEFTYEKNKNAFICMRVVNFGPSSNKIGSVLIRKNWFQRTIFYHKNSLYCILTNKNHPASTPTPYNNRVEVGDEVKFAFDFPNDLFLKDDLHQIGIIDGFGRKHWAPKRELAKIKKIYKKVLDRDILNT